MIKIVLEDPKIFSACMRTPLLNRVVTYNIECIDSIGDPSLRTEILSRVTTASMHGKMTRNGRFDDVDEKTICYIAGMHAPAVHDIAVSCGATSCDLLRRLAAAGVSAEFYISDKYSVYYSTGDAVVRIYSEEREFLYGYVFCLLADASLPFYYVGSRILYLVLKYWPFRGNSYREINLLDPETKNNIKTGRFSFIEYDVFSATIRDKYSFVRCMNLLNSNSWFTGDQIEKALRNIRESLKDGGVLQIGRTEDGSGINNVGFYRKMQGRFVLLEKVNGGAELDALIVSI